MLDVKPWEEGPDEGYWRTLLGESTLASKDENPSGDAAPPTEPPTPSGWQIAETSYAQGATLELRVVGHNRGGLLVDLGDVRGFVPASQLVSFPRQAQEETRMQELARYVGTALRLKVIEFDRAHNRLILSERVANPPISRAEQLLATIEPQQTRRGVVRNVTNFGAFVDLGGVEGLIHVSELSWQYVAHPSEVLTPGQTVDVYVMDVDREQKRIACSLKRLKPNPWAQVAEKLHPGDWVNGVVTSVVGFGAFVRVADGVEGLVHVSELEGNFVHPREVVQEGQSVQVRVMEIDPNQQRMKLSMRRADAKGNGADSSAANNEARKTNVSSRKIPPAPPIDPGYWESLVKTG